jgi:hypothetical protein
MAVEIGEKIINKTIPNIKKLIVLIGVVFSVVENNFFFFF